MIFQFFHLNFPCTAYVVYNGFQISDTMLISIVDCKNELGEEITFKLIKERTWQTEDIIKNKFPSTYTNLCSKLNEIFVDNNFVFCVD